MLGLAAIYFAIWKTRNCVCFDKKHINNPIEILFSACAFMLYWVGMYPKTTKKEIEVGVNMLMKTATQLIKKDPPKTAPVLMIKDAMPEDSALEDDQS
jgi:hypothetical protein